MCIFIAETVVQIHAYELYNYKLNLGFKSMPLRVFICQTMEQYFPALQPFCKNVLIWTIFHLDLQTNLLPGLNIRRKLFSMHTVDCSFFNWKQHGGWKWNLRKAKLANSTKMSTTCPLIATEKANKEKPHLLCHNFIPPVLCIQAPVCHYLQARPATHSKQ